MKLVHPLKSFTISQWFDENATSIYKEWGLKGHGALDYDIPYGTPIYAALDAEVYTVLNKDNSDLSKYRGVFQIYDEPEGIISYEIGYGHCSDIIATPGLNAKVGDLLAKVGNTGDVFVGGVYVSKEEKMRGSKLGAHLHFQVRKCKRVKRTIKGKYYLSDANGKFKRNNMYYEYFDYGNGYNSCVDPAQFFSDDFKFLNDLKLGDTHPDVIRLQKRLNLNSKTQVAIIGPGSSGSETDYFGQKTKDAVIRFQRINGIMPMSGFFGPLSRNRMNIYN